MCSPGSNGPGAPLSRPFPGQPSDTDAEDKGMERLSPRGHGSVCALLFLTVCLSGCGGSRAAGPPEVRTVDGTDIELLPTEATFVSVRDLFVSEGSVWVLDGAEPFVVRAPLEGGEVVAFGREGEGPGEFLRPQAIQPTSGGEAPGVRVWDFGTGRVSAFDPLGTLRGSERMADEGIIRARTDLGRVSYVDPFRVRNDRMGVLAAQFPGPVLHTSDIRTGALRRTDSRLGPGQVLVPFAEFAGGETSDTREWVEVPLWDACDGSVVLWSSDSSRVVWLDAQGGRAESVDVDVAPSPVSLEDIQRFLRRMARLEIGPDFENAGLDFAAIAASAREQFAPTRPIATDLRCESRSAAWIRRFGNEHDPIGRGRRWLRVSTADRPMEVTFPPDFLPLAFTGGVAYGMVEGADGAQRIGRWTEK